MFAAKQQHTQDTASALVNGLRHTAPTAPRHGSSDFLQRQLGNRRFQEISMGRPLSIQRACGCGGTCASCSGKKEETLPIQARLKVGPANDRYERQADRVADAVMRMPESQLQRQGLEEEELLQTKPLANQITPLVQRQAMEKDEELLQTKLSVQRQGLEEEEGSLQTKPLVQREARAGGGASAPAMAHNILRSPGQPLDAGVRTFMESRFGTDFGGVRVHTGVQAGVAARSVQARAYTVGHHVVFGAGEYTPGTDTGKRLMAHELTHVVQQAGGGAPCAVQRQSAPGGAAGATAPSLGGLTEEMVRQIARNLHEAMSGLGTDEDAIYAAFAGRMQEQVNAIERVYNDMFDRNLTADLHDELTESELRQLAVFGGASGRTADEGATATGALAEMVADRLHGAMDRIGTDEASIFAALTGRTVVERRAIAEAYQRLTGRTLAADLRDELSGSDLVRALRLLNEGMLAPEDELYLSMAGLGTDEDTLFRVLDALAGDNAVITAMETRYRQKYGDLITHLRDDLTASEYQRAIAILGPVIQDVDFQDCSVANLTILRQRMPLVNQKINRALTVLSAGWAGMSTTDRASFNQYFDPGHNGGVDQGFIDDVVSNFRALRSEFDAGITFECEGAGGLCGTSSRYAYTFFSDIHICPHFWTMSNNDQSWGILHELTHNALWAVDRAYGHEPGFMDLTPRGTPANQIPIFGPLIRLIARDDTLNNPDSYALFAFNV